MANELIEFKAGEIIFSEGDPGGSIYIIRRGWLRFSKNLAMKTSL